MTLSAWITTMAGRLRERLCCHNLLRLELKRARDDVERLDRALDSHRAERLYLFAQIETLTDSNAAKADRLDRLGETVVKMRAENEALKALLYEVSAWATRDDDLPDGLLPRIDAALKEQPCP